MLLTMLLQVSRSQVNRAIMMTKEKDLEILCDLVVSGNVFHAGIAGSGGHRVKITPFTSRIGTGRESGFGHYAYQSIPFWVGLGADAISKGESCCTKPPEPLLQRGCGPAIQAKNGLGCS